MNSRLILSASIAVLLASTAMSRADELDTISAAVQQVQAAVPDAARSEETRKDFTAINGDLNTIAGARKTVDDSNAALAAAKADASKAQADYNAARQDYQPQAKLVGEKLDELNNIKKAYSSAGLAQANKDLNAATKTMNEERYTWIPRATQSVKETEGLPASDPRRKAAVDGLANANRIYQQAEQRAISAAEIITKPENGLAKIQSAQQDYNNAKAKLDSLNNAQNSYATKLNTANATIAKTQNVIQAASDTIKKTELHAAGLAAKTLNEANADLTTYQQKQAAAAKAAQAPAIASGATPAIGNSAGSPLAGGANPGAGIVATGGGNLVATGGGNLIGHDGASVVATGGGNLIGHDGASVVATGGGNLIGHDGASVVATGGGNLIGHDGSSVVATGGGNLIATGGGNVIAAGAGNLAGKNGAGIVATGGGNLIGHDGSSVVATGGGNLIATGGGNVIAAGAGNLTGKSGAGVIAAGAGNLVGPGGSSLVSTNGGNVIAAGAGNVIAAGAGNFIGNAGGALIGNAGGALGPQLAGGMLANLAPSSLQLASASAFKQDSRITAFSNIETPQEQLQKAVGNLNKADHEALQKLVDQQHAGKPLTPDQATQAAALLNKAARTMDPGAVKTLEQKVTASVALKAVNNSASAIVLQHAVQDAKNDPLVASAVLKASVGQKPTADEAKHLDAAVTSTVAKLPVSATDKQAISQTAQTHVATIVANPTPVAPAGTSTGPKAPSAAPAPMSQAVVNAMLQYGGTVMQGLQAQREAAIKSGNTTLAAGLSQSVANLQAQMDQAKRQAASTPAAVVATAQPAAKVVPAVVKPAAVTVPPVTQAKAPEPAKATTLVKQEPPKAVVSKPAVTIAVPEKKTAPPVQAGKPETKKVASQPPVQVKVEAPKAKAVAVTHAKPAPKAPVHNVRTPATRTSAVVAKPAPKAPAPKIAPPKPRTCSMQMGHMVCN